MRTFSPAGNSIFPGSAIEFEGIYYEIFFQDYASVPKLTISYYLKKWDNRFPIRVQFHYNEQECRNTALSYRTRVNTNRLRALLTLFSPIAGMLPAEDQIRIGNKYGMQATRMTFFSALLLIIPAGFLILFCISYWFARTPLPGPPWIHWIYPLGFYFFLESLLRMLTAIKMDDPVGSIILSLPVLLWRSLQRPFVAGRTPNPLNDNSSTSRATIPDRLNFSDDQEHLEITSVLPKPHWNSRVGIGINGSWYGLIESGKMIRDNATDYRFLLRKAPEGTWFASVIEYSPDEVQVLYKNKRRLDLKTWVDTFAWFWGLLGREDQRRLDDLYDFDSLKFSKLTIITIAILSISNLIVSFINLTYGVATAIDVWLLLPAGFLLLECYSRWTDLKAGEPSGSILGLLVRPFARKLLQGP